MKLLAFDTSTNTCTIVLYDNRRAITDNRIIRQIHAPHQHSALILSIIEQMLIGFGWSLNDLNCIAFGCGPGSFTGSRLACSVAQALGFGLDIPLISISSLHLLAKTCSQQTDYRNISICIDARMNLLYWANYIFDDDGKVIPSSGEELLIHAENIESLTANISKNCNVKNNIGVGDGWAKYDQLLRKNALWPGRLWDGMAPSGEALIEIASEKFVRESFITIEEAIPTYLSRLD